jgi:general stress protein 26
MEQPGRFETQQFCSLVDDIPFAMVTTRAADGCLRSRPMVASTKAFNGQLWFVVRTTASVADEIRHDAQVNVTYVSAPEDRFISVSGTAVVVRDVARATDMWLSVYQAWFAGGPSDPELSLVRVDPTRVEYWDRKTGRMRGLAGS